MLGSLVLSSDWIAAVECWSFCVGFVVNERHWRRFSSPSLFIFLCLFMNPTHSHANVSLHPLCVAALTRQHIVTLSSFIFGLHLLFALGYTRSCFFDFKFIVMLPQEILWAFQWTVCSALSWWSSSNFALTRCIVLVSTGKGIAMGKLIVWHNVYNTIGFCTEHYPNPAHM